MRLLLLLLCGCEGGEYSIEILLPNKFPKLHPRIAKTNFHQTLVQGKIIRIWCQGFHLLCGARSPEILIYEVILILILILILTLILIHRSTYYQLSTKIDSRVSNTVKFRDSAVSFGGI